MVLRMPAELGPHERTVMCWPARAETYPGPSMAEAEAAHAEVARVIAGFEPVTMIARPGPAAARAAEMCGGGVEVVELPIDDSWFRDSGPIYVVDGPRRLAVDWTFNAWGEKFRPYTDDAAITARWTELAGHERVAVPMVFEGGAISVDGSGTAVTTIECLMHPNRNPELDQAAIEGTVRSALGVDALIWLPHGLALDDDTDGHVDNVAAFAGPGVLVVQGCDDPAEEDWLRMHINRRVAAGATDARGERLRIVEVPVLPFVEHFGQRVVVPYVNYYVGNGFVLVPTCGHPADADMLAIIAEVHPGREVVGLDVGAILAVGGGGIHCITQQIPAI